MNFDNADEYLNKNSENVENIGMHYLSHLPKDMIRWIDDHTNELICMVNQHGKLIFISPSVEKLLGYKQEELLETSFWRIIDHEDHNILQNLFSEDIQKTQYFQIRMIDHSGSSFWFEFDVTSFIDNHLHKCYLSLGRPITVRKDVEELLVHSEKMSVAGQFSAGIAHEIRNPLTSLKGFLQLLITNEKGKEPYLKIMEEEIEKIEGITSELLSVSKPLTYEMKDESLNQLIKDVCLLMQSQAKLHNIYIHYHEPGNLFTIYCDRSQIKQVFINLIKNAIEVMQDGGEIHVHLYEEETYCLVDIVDEGPGVPDGIMDQIRKPFFTTKEDGTGLGLMVTQQIIDRHQGILNIKRNKDKGSTFQVLLPKRDNKTHLK